MLLMSAVKRTRLGRPEPMASTSKFRQCSKERHRHMWAEWACHVKLKCIKPYYILKCRTGPGADIILKIFRKLAVAAVKLQVQEKTYNLNSKFKPGVHNTGSRGASYLDLIRWRWSPQAQFLSLYKIASRQVSRATVLRRLFLGKAAKFIPKGYSPQRMWGAFHRTLSVSALWVGAPTPAIPHKICSYFLLKVSCAFLMSESIVHPTPQHTSNSLPRQMMLNAMKALAAPA